MRPKIVGKLKLNGAVTEPLVRLAGPAVPAAPAHPECCEACGTELGGASPAGFFEDFEDHASQFASRFCSVRCYHNYGLVMVREVRRLGTGGHGAA